MSNTPWIKFYSSDWLAGTSGLTAAERGVYITICALIYEFDGPIQLDEARLARRCGCPKGPFRKILKALVDEGKLTVSLGMIDNEKCAREIAERKKTSERQSLVARARWNEQSEKTVEKQGQKNATGMPRECQPEPEPESEGSANALPKRGREKNPPDGFDEFWSLVPIKAAKPKCMANYQKAIRDGATPDQINAGMRRYRDWLEALGPQAPKAKYPQGWLTDERWNDELPDPSTQLRNGRGNTHGQLAKINDWFKPNGDSGPELDCNSGGVEPGRELPDDGRRGEAHDFDGLGFRSGEISEAHYRAGVHGSPSELDVPAETGRNHQVGFFKVIDGAGGGW